MHRIRRAVTVGLMAAVTATTAACLPAPPPAYPGYQSTVYDKAENWLCRPDVSGDPCDGPLDATVVPADGHLSVEPLRPAVQPAADCFYVYPTTSRDPGLFSDLRWTMAEEGVFAQQEAARFSSACRVFAPLYEQVTVTSIFDGRSQIDPRGNAEHSYAGVLDAWKQYISHDNGGRDFILIGHSQGAGMASMLLQREIEPNPALRKRFVGAYLAGNDMQVPAGSDTPVGFKTPLCTRFGQTGCIVSYGPFRSTVPPAPTSLFAHDAGNGLEDACVNPATLLRPWDLPGSREWLSPYFPTVSMVFEGVPGQWVDPAYGTVSTPQVRTPRFVEGQCVGRDGYHWLEVTVHGDPADPRLDDIGGDLAIPGLVTPEVFGLHNIAANLVLGDLVTLARLQVLLH